MKMSGNTTTTISKMIMLYQKDGKLLSLSGDEKGLVTKVYYDGTDGYTYIKSLKKTPFDDNTKKIYKDLKNNSLGTLKVALFFVH